jgi:23S rRNA pseudouridine1911/1915/1917 synthase
MKTEETIPAALNGERLDRIVSLIADISRADASQLIDNGGAMVDGQPAPSGKVRLKEGQVIEVDLDKAPVEALPQADLSIKVHIVYEDDTIVVVNKPAGLVVHPAAGHKGETLVNGLLALYPEMSEVGERHRPGIVHRLDVGTTGLMVVARTNDAYHSLVEAMSDHAVGRRYLALAWGRFDATSGVIDAPIGRDPRDPLRMAVVRNGKFARTHFEVQKVFAHPGVISLVECSLETGRTHQIRVHLAAVQHPVLGDGTYGGARSTLSAPRPMLHAAKLQLVHPATGAEMEFEAPLPDDFVAVLAQCEEEVPE